MKIKWKRKEEPVPIDWGAEVFRLSGELAYAQLMHQQTTVGYSSLYATTTQVYTPSPVYYTSGTCITTTNLTSTFKQTI